MPLPLLAGEGWDGGNEGDLNFNDMKNSTDFAELALCAHHYLQLGTPDPCGSNNTLPTFVLHRARSLAC